MILYPKINTIWKRDERGKVIEGDFSDPETEYLYNCVWDITEKVDGTNIRVGWDGNNLEFGGRTENAQIPAKLTNRLREMFDVGLLERTFPDVSQVVLFGEGYGAGIQSGGNYRQDQSFILFDVCVGDWWLLRSDVMDIADKLNIDVVPVWQSTLAEANELVRSGLPSAIGTAPAEGVVARTPPMLFNRRGSPILVKIKTRDYR